MTDFPRGWTLSNVAIAGAAASITVPATSGVVHVLDAIFGRAVNTTGAAAFNVAIVASGVTLQVQLIVPAAVSVDEVSLSGLDLATAPGVALTVAFNVVAPAGYQEVLVLQGHDI